MAILEKIGNAGMVKMVSHKQHIHIEHAPSKKKKKEKKAAKEMGTTMHNQHKYLNHRKPNTLMVI